MVYVSKGDFIWVEPTQSVVGATTVDENVVPSPIPIGARVLSASAASGERIVVVDDDGNERRLSADQKVRVMHPTSIQSVEDLVRLEDLHEAAVVRNLAIRYREKLIYTYAGTVLIAVNPQRPLPSLHSAEQIALYQQQRAESLPPHVYGVVSRAVRAAANASRDQCIIVDGPTGSGKSENIRHILKYFAQQNAFVMGRQDEAAPRGLCCAQQLLDANLILEAFGNAQTTANSNATRHAKFIDIRLKSAAGSYAVDGVQIAHYWLDRARLVSPPAAAGDRNYHIFYTLLKDLSASDKYELELGGVDEYHILAQDCYDYESRSLSWRPSTLPQIRCAMKSLMFKDAEVTSTLKVLAAILHMGNLKYHVKSDGDDSGNQHVEIADRTNIRRIAKLLQLNPENLSSALSQRTTVLSDSGECVITGIGARRALDTRDALIRGIYARLFAYLVRRCNETLDAPSGWVVENGTVNSSNNPYSTSDYHYNSHYETTHSRHVSLGLLDLAGFDGRPAGVDGAFEQFVANLTAERLQQFYIRVAFRVEQADYEAQHIDHRYVDCGAVDNAGCLDLLILQPMSIASVLNDESIRPEATCDSFLAKLHTQHEHNPLYGRPKSALSRQFAVNHYAEPVTYQACEFLFHNRDHFTADLLALIESSRFKFLRRLFFIGDENEVGSGEGCKDSNLRAGTGAPMRQTRVLQYRRAIDTLLQRLEQRQTHFIRCIQPNASGGEMKFDRELVANQLRNWGVIETTLMQRNGYPVRYDYATFVRKYRMFLPNGGAPCDANCAYAARHICSVLLADSVDYKFGKTTLFLKAEQELFLDQELAKVLTHYATVVQKSVRGWIQRRRLILLRQAAIVLQKNWRACTQRRRYEMILRGINRLQALLRSHQLIQHYDRLKSIVTHFQAHCRGAIVREMLRSAITVEDCRAAIADRHSNLKQCNSEQQRHEDDLCFNDDARFNPIPDGPDLELDETKIRSHSFEKFAAAYFQTVPAGRKPLRHPLLRSDAQAPNGGRMAALCVWACVQRLTGALSSSNSIKKTASNEMARSLSTRSLKVKEFGDCRNYIKLTNVRECSKIFSGSLPLMRNLYLAIGKSSGKKEYQQFLLAYFSLYETDGDKLPKTNDKNGETYKEKTNFFAKFVADILQASQMQLIQYVVGCGILSSSLRDEILCQICHLLKNVRSQLSRERCWTILALCVGCFAPSTKFFNYFTAFLRDMQSDKLLYGYAQFVARRLRRTLDNGARCQPPSREEVEACKSKRHLRLAVLLMDGGVIHLPADSATTSAEICSEVARRVGLPDDTFGFALYATFSGGDKVVSLGDGADRVMDAISQGEQAAGHNGRDNCRLFYRKEIFEPWHHSNDNSPATNLIYHQIVRGVRHGEYKFEKDEDLAMLCAQQYFIDYGHNVQPAVLDEALFGYLPANWCNDDDTAAAKWSQIVLNILRKKFAKESQETVELVKSNVVSTATRKWPLLFSRFCEATKFAGPPLKTNDVVIAVNAEGVTVLEEANDQRMLDFSYVELTRVRYNRSKRVGADTVTLHTLSGDAYTFQSPNARDIGALVERFVAGLRQRSVYVLYAHKMRGAENSERLECQKGDLLILSQPHKKHKAETENAPQSHSVNWLAVENARTGLHGRVPAAEVYVLPTLVRPSVDLLKQFARRLNLNENQSTTVQRLTEDDRLMAVYGGRQLIACPPCSHTLERFAAANFNLSSGAYGSRDGDDLSADSSPPSSTSAGRGPDPWKWSPSPLRTPLLRRVGGAASPAGAESLLSYEHILRYMGDIPAPPPAYFLEITDRIFRGAVKYQILRDELYCQLIRQLTDNPRPFGERRGWELMWLCVGLFPASTRLADEITAFLKSRQAYQPLATDCLRRFQRTIKLNAVRKYPPHQVEVEAVQQGSTQIFHKVQLPDGGEMAVEVDSLTTAADIGTRILRQLRVRAPPSAGFGAFVKVGERAYRSNSVVSMPDKEYAFDFLHQLAEWSLNQNNQSSANKTSNAKSAQSQSTSQSAPFAYQLFYMRKLWIDVVPGEDYEADIHFHYHQELPKYLRGYHAVDRTLAVQIGAVILRAQTRDGCQPPFAQFAHIVAELVPRQLVKSQSVSEWRKVISVEFEKLDAKTSADGKILFLRRIAALPTFGSAFFEVKQSSDPTLAYRLIVAINRTGVNLFDQDRRKHILSYPFTAINSWTFGNTYLHLTIGNALKGKRLLLETTLGYKMDDLLTSYIQALLAAMERRKSAGHEMEII